MAIATTAIALLATLAASLGTLVTRPYDGVEGEVLFDASRIRDGLTLYVDPLAGAFDYGAVPARYYVLYVPVWAWVVAHVPRGAAAIAARSFDAAAWFGVLAWIAWRAKPACRHVALYAAAYVAGFHVLATYGTSARPDAIALLLAGVALVRSVKRGSVDAFAGALFALAAWCKPNVVGLAGGAFLVEILLRRARALPAILGALAVSVTLAVTMQVASSGAWLVHLARSTGQPLDASLWWEQMTSRFQFLAFPLAFAAWCGRRARGDAGVRIAFGALGASVAWAVFSLAKVGSASNYWMEPCIAALVVLAHAPVDERVLGQGLTRLRSRPAVGRAQTWFSAGLLLQALWTGVASVRGAMDRFVEVPVHSRALAHARDVCHAGPRDVIIADEPGLELEMNDRIVTTAFQMTHLAERGRYPIAMWIEDVRRPEVVGLVMEDDLLERPAGEVNLEHDRFSLPMRAALNARFVLAETNGAWRTYRLRAPPP